MKIKIKKEKYTTNERMFLIIWTFYSAAYFLLGSELGIDYEIDILNKIATYFTLLMQASMLFLVNRYKLKDALKYSMLLMTIALIEMSNSDGSLLVYVLFVILAQYMDIDKLLHYDVILKTILLLIIVGLCAVGITLNYSALINGTYKQSLGFSHPNVFTAYVLIILVEWLCIRYSKAKWYEWLLIFGLAFLTMWIGGGRSSIYTFILIIFFFALARLVPKLFFIKPVIFSYTIVTPLMAIVSFFAVYLYNKGNSIVAMLDEVMTHRISLAASFLNTYSVKLFGQDIEYVSTRASQTNNSIASILDNAYIRCALDWGLLFFAFIIVSYVFLLRKLLLLKRVDLSLLCLFFVLIGLGETYMLKPIYNLSLLCLLGFHGFNNKTDDTISQLSKKNFKIKYKIRI